MQQATSDGVIYIQQKSKHMLSRKHSHIKGSFMHAQLCSIAAVVSSTASNFPYACFNLPTKLLRIRRASIVSSDRYYYNNNNYYYYYYCYYYDFKDMAFACVFSTGQTVSASYHLCNREAKRVLVVSVDNKRLEHKLAPKYLGVRLDRTLSYKQHLEKV